MMGRIISWERRRPAGLRERGFPVPVDNWRFGRFSPGTPKRCHAALCHRTP